MKTTRTISIVVCLIMVFCFMTACSSKTPQTVTGFTKIMEAAKFDVQDVTSSTETNGIATTVLVAVGEDYQIEFFELTDSEMGENVFYYNKQLFLDEHSTTSMSQEFTSDNYNYYHFDADGNFHLIAHIENTMIYCEAEKEYKNEIIEFVKTLGYK